uniref:Translation initiation factor 2D n=1 Tax=Tetraselmis sp. GSL018 TaxID=582737 RepID=A0A061RIW1_9CHLO
MLPQQLISRGSVRVLKKGNLSPISIQTKKRQGNKKVTCVVGLETFAVDPKQFANRVQRRFACSASYDELEGSKNKNHYEIVIQGDKATQIAHLLMDDYGVPQKFISNADACSRKGK